MATEMAIARRRLGAMAVADELHGPTLSSYYYCHPSAGHTFYDSSRGYESADASRLPTVDLGPLGPVATPTAVAQVALDLFGRAERTGDPERRTRLMEQFGDLAGELVRRIELRTAPDGTRFAVWPFDAANPWFPFSGPRWVSGLTSGIGLSVLLRALQTTDREHLLDLADLVLVGFAVPVQHGGTACHGVHGPFFEEVPSLPCTHVLNGHVFALFGIHDHYRVTGSETARELFVTGVAALKARLPEYAGRFWSRYDSRRSSWSGPAPPFYQLLHCVQMRALAALTGEQAFEAAAVEWEGQCQTRAGMAAYLLGRQWHRARRRLVARRFSPPRPPICPGGAAVDQAGLLSAGS